MINAASFKWSPSSVAKFWDYLSGKKDDLEYFSNLFGDGIVNFASYILSLHNKEVLDYGCGPGYLTSHLLAKGASVSGLDYSEASVKTVQSLFATHSKWKGAELASGSGSLRPDSIYDFVYCIEVIEHVLPEHLNKTFLEIFRLLKPGGVALFTTPYEEKLECNFIFCPNCESEFHNRQHLRSWTKELLKQKLEKSGYAVLFCEGLHFGIFKDRLPLSWKDISPRHIKIAADLIRLGLLDRIRPKAFPYSRVFRKLVSMTEKIHLVAVAAKL